MQRVLILFLFLSSVCIISPAQHVAVTDAGNTITLNNNIVSFTFNKHSADITAIENSKHTSLLGKKGRGYLLGPGFSLNPCTFTIVRQTDSLVELSFLHHQASNHFTYDIHYVLRTGDAGVYCFLEQSHATGDSTGDYGQTRWGISADETLFNYHLVRDSIQGPMPLMSELKESIQDWTYKLNDSVYYTKYDYADYIEGRHVHGMAGTNSGLGMFVIQASHEYLNGGPTKQFQDVHSTPFLICMFNCGHFLSDTRKGDNKINGDWHKLSGPFFLYVNSGKNVDAIWSDAKKQAQAEVNKWPYQWMQNNDYPLERGSVSGKLLINNRPAQAGTHVILAAPGYDWQAQSQGYIYYALTTADGMFNIKNIRNGNYTLYAYGSNVTEEYVQNNVGVHTNTVNMLGKINWQPVKNGDLLWQVGIADRKTTGFKLSDHKRYYNVFMQPPADLTYTIPTSKEKKDWYYAQTKQGSWNIVFPDNKAYDGQATLTIAFAGYARNPKLDVLVNDSIVGTIHGGNDASVYRSAIAGGYYQLKKLNFPASLLKQGSNNTISFKLSNVKDGAGVMYDAIKLEVN